MVFGGTRRALLCSSAFLWFVALTATSPDAVAQRSSKKPPVAESGSNKTRAAGLFKKSSEAYLHGDFATAIKLLDEAYALDAQPILVYNMARAHEGLGHVDEAVTLYERYLSQDPGSSDRGAIEQRLATLHRQQEEKKRLEKEKIDVEKDRAQNQQQQEQLAQRERDQQNAPGPEPIRKRSVMPYVVAGAGIAGLAVGGVFGVLALDKKDEANKEPAQRDATSLRDKGQTLATVANISFVVGGILLAGGVIWWVLDRPSSKRRGAIPPPAAPTNVRLGFTPGGMVLGGTF